MALTVVDHPLIQHHLSRLRDRRTGPETFRQALHQVAALMIYECTRSLSTRAVTVRTPLGHAPSRRLRHPVLLVPILRAGLGMLNSLLEVVPEAQVGFVGVSRDPVSLRPSVYHKSLPADVRSSEIVVLDPMLATGGSAVATLELLAQRGARRQRLIMICLVAAPEGVARVQERFPDLSIYAAAVDPRLNARGYIVPGLGDAGDRLFGV
jgi:uracil phosphoribosyltransferase